MSEIDEIECRDCSGYGWMSRREATNVLGDCTFCNGTGWRVPTQDELDNMAEDAYQRQFEGEPPSSAQERYERDWKQKQELRR